MPKYKVNAYLVHDGKVLQPGRIIDIEDKLAEQLGDKVTITEAGKLESLKLDDLKEQAKIEGITGYSDMKKKELISALVKEKE